MNIVFEMKSLILLLFLGAVVFALAEEPVEDEAVQEYLDEVEDETITDLADEENDPRRGPRPSRRPSKWLVRSPPLSPFLNRLLGCMCRINLICLRLLLTPLQNRFSV